MSAGHDAATASPTSDGRPVVRRALESRSGAVLAVASVVFALVVGLRATGVLQELELGLYDQYVRQFDAHSSASRVVVVGVTEDDIRALGHWPLTDTELAAALERLAELGPRAVGIDIYRDIEVRDTGGGSGQPALRAVFRKYPFLIAPMRFGDGPPFAVPPPPFLSGFDQVGFVDVVIDDDGKVRRGLLYLDDGETSYESMSLKLALLELQAEEIAPAPDPSHPEYLRLGRSTFRPFRSDDGGYSGADDRGYQYLLDFGAGGTPYKVFPLATLTGGRVPRAEVEGKVALIGVTAGSVPDTFYVASSRVGGDATALRGLMLHARLVDQLMSAALDGRRPLRPIAGWQEVGLILAVSLLGGGAGLWTRSPWRFLGVVLLGTAALVIGGYALFAARLWLPVAAPALAWAASAAGVTAYTVGLERRQRGLLMRLFRSHVSPEVADAIWQQRQQFMEGGRARPQRVVATVLFSDLRGFTTLSEGMEPAALLDWLNQYMEAMAHEVMRHHGVVDKYIGDAVMAVFGVPIARRSEAEIGGDAANAVECALAMEHRLTEMNAGWREQGLPSVGMRIGVFTGPLVAGSLGATDRMNYTVLGDTVNTASRLESLRDPSVDADQTATSCRILIGDATLAYVGPRFETREVGAMSLKGKKEQIKLHRVIGRRTADPSAANEEDGR